MPFVLSNRGRLTVENGLTRWPGSPVNGILQYSGYTVVVLRRRDEHRVRFANRCLKRLHRLRIAFIVNVGVVWRNISKTSEYLNFHARRRQFNGGTQPPSVNDPSLRLPGMPTTLTP